MPGRPTEYDSILYVDEVLVVYLVPGQVLRNVDEGCRGVRVDP